MASGNFLKAFDARRLLLLVALLFLALAVPTAALIWQAYGQLKWEAFHQHRGMAEELTARIDADLGERIRAAEARGFTDFAFLVVSGDPAANFLQRSPLAEYPVPQDIPGVIGYFQVDADGSFRTPLLPPADAALDKLGIPPQELAERRLLAEEIHRVLADNRLVRDSTASVAPLREAAMESEAERQQEKRKDDYSQQVFDQLNSAPQTQAPAAGTMAVTGNETDLDAQEEVAAYGKVADLKLDASLQKKSESLEGKSIAADTVATKANADANLAGRARRLEQSALPQLSSSPPSPSSEPVEAGLDASADVAVRVSTFASEIDPYEFSLLSSGHLVLFRKVWRNGERLIQGLLVDTESFLSSTVDREFRATSLAEMSDLVIAYHDDVIRLLRGAESGRYPVSSDELQGTLLYRSRLTAPLDALELIFSINRLPAGPGARVLGWITLIIAAVFVTGFLLVYRLGLGQIRLARQQQDFVSAVSHELKTPLTSIRMYGEMLKEGWVSEEKRKQYYEYIHDESERLTRLIANVLHLAKITRAEPQLELKRKSVAELLSQVESKVGSQIGRAGFTLNLVAGSVDDKASVMVDEDAFTQIIINLVDNAIKFSGNAANKVIDIGCQATGDGNAVFTLRDYGPGIPKSQMKKIFQLFYRAESELTRETVGTGIGLAIVHQLAALMNAKVDVVNKEPGAEFRLSFPLVTQ